MNQDQPLFLYEEILLLALRDKEGTVEAGSMYPYAVSGGILAELLLQRKIRVEDSKKKKVEVIDRKPLGDPILDECLDKIQTAKRPKGLQHWGSHFAQLKKLKHRVAEQLCERGILKSDEGKVLFIFTRQIYPEIDPKPEREIVDRLKKAIFTYTKEIEPRTVVLLSLANGADLLRMVFDKKKLKAKKERINKIINGEVMGKAAKEVIDAVQAAMVVAAIIPAIVVTSSAN